jgi:hypothetical protein
MLWPTETYRRGQLSHQLMAGERVALGRASIILTPKNIELVVLPLGIESHCGVEIGQRLDPCLFCGAQDEIVR